MVNVIRVVKGVNDIQTLQYGDLKPSFSNFIHVLVQESNSFNEHWYPMFGLCDPCHFQFDYVVKMENLSNESLAVLKLVRSEFDTF